MTDETKKYQVEDGNLDEISGGAQLHYGMENDPLYIKFNSVWNGNKGDKGSGMDSREESMNAFRLWVRDGVPENISEWYENRETK